MKNDGQAIFRTLLPALLVLVACGGAKHPAATTGSGGAAAGATGAAGANGFAGSSGSGGTGGVDMGGAGITGSGGNAGTTGTAGDTASGTAGTTGGSDSGAPDDGAGPDAPPPDAAFGGTPLPPYDGGIVNVINAGNWNETTIYPFSKRRMLVRDEGDPHLVLVDFGIPNPIVWRKVTGGPWSRGIQLIGNNQVLGGRNDGYEVFDLKDGRVDKTVNMFGNTQSAYRMANGETMLTQSGTVLTFLDKADRASHAITYPGFGYVRMARPTRDKTFLVPSDTKLFEGDANGNILWTATAAPWSHVWEPLLMSDGNVLLATFFGSSLDIVDRNTHIVTKRYGTKAMPMAATFRPNGFAEFQILPNGNLITSNWQGQGGGASNVAFGIQVIEFNPAGDVAWFYKQDPTAFSSIQGVMVIDGMDPAYLHVQEISPDSTWQPVIPTP